MIEEDILKYAEETWGVSWKDAGLKLAEECGETIGEIKRDAEGRGSKSAIKEELGDLLFVCAQIAAKLDSTCDELLRERITQRHPNLLV